MPLQVLPDVVALTRSYLLTVPELVAVVGARIATKSDQTPVYPYITLQRIGGAAVIDERLDSARIQFDAWAETESDASLAIRTLRAALFAVGRTGGFVAVGGVLASAIDIQGPNWQPDTSRTPPIPRFTTTLAIGARTP